MKASLEELAAWVNALPDMAQAAQWQVHGNAMITGIATDSRKIGASDLFVALAGERFDAHDFLPQVQTLAAAVLVQRPPANPNLPYILVPNTRIALGHLAQAWRSRFTLPLIAVTGSNGKTTVKEMISLILACAFGTGQRLATQGNLNNEIGVPLTLLGLCSAHRAAVVELGMNHPGEIAWLGGLTRPTVALINNAQREHLEFMCNVAAVAQENGSVLRSLTGRRKPAGVAVFPDDEEFTPLWRELAHEAGAKVLTFGLAKNVGDRAADRLEYSNTADITCEYLGNDLGNMLRVKIKNDGQITTSPLTLAALGEHNVRNALAAIACTLAIGIDISVIIKALEAFQPVSGRLQPKTANNGANLIDDSYNANPDSVRAAIQVLAQSRTNRILVLGDMGEVGNQGPQFHTEVGQFAKQQGIEHLFCLGSLCVHAQHAFGAGARHFESMPELLAALTQLPDPKNSTILVKGSRFMKMERVVQHLSIVPADSSLQEVH